MKGFLIFIIIFGAFDPMNGQDFEFYDVPFYKNNTKLRFPNTGGIKNPMFSNIDFNGDGKNDLFIFDKEGEVVLPFLYTGENHEIRFDFAPQYIKNFPKLRNFALLVDFNNDGIEDIFTGGYIPSTVDVYRGKIQNGQIVFDLVKFDFPGSLGNFLQIYQNGYSQVYVSNIDVPAILDVDHDGDLDILAFPPASDKLTYYQNVSKEENLPDDTLKFQINTMCWGGFKEDDFSAEIYLSSNSDDCYNFRDPDKGEVRHSGSTSLLLDIDGDGDMDLLLGDLSNDHLKLLVNHGTPQKAWINEVDHQYPSDDVSANMQVFLAAYHVDVNNDGKRDLIVTPNDRNDSERNNHIWLYLNQGTDSHPDFVLFTKSFMVDETISMGSGSHPCFLDYNGDGLMDLLLGGNGIIQNDGSRKTWMELYKNTGTLTDPVFTLEDPDYLEFFKFVTPILRLAPTSGDLDGDGDEDILVGEFLGKLFYYENKAGKGNPVQFEPRQYPYQNIFVGNNAKPAIFDINNDGLTDIVVGEINNELNYFQNFGSEGSPQFNSSLSTPPNTKGLGHIFPGQNNYYLESGAPFFYEGSNEIVLLFGNQGGQIRMYSYEAYIPDEPFELKTETLGNVYVGNRTVPVLADLNNDGFYEMAIGNERGGITFFKTTLKKNTVSVESGNVNTFPKFFPNPAFDKITISGDQKQDITIYNIHGQRLVIPTSQKDIDVSALSPGIYFLHIDESTTYSIHKLVIVK